MIIGTLLVRDEEEILEECILHHLNNGVDLFIATDNNSTDSTRDILNKYVKEIILEPNLNYEQGKWVTRMAQMCCDYKPDWIVHIDADEFWYGLPTIYEISKEFGVVFLPNHYYDHIPTDNYTSRKSMPFYEKTIRTPTNKNGIRLIHRPSKNVIVHQGNHGVDKVPGKKFHLLNDSICMHHYSIRTYQQYEKKIIAGGQAYELYPGNKSHGIHWRNNYELYKQGKLRDVYDKLTMDKEKYKKITNGEICISYFL